MTDKSESDQPNEYGFGGGATAPEPEPTREPIDEVDGESVAVPAGDLTGSITDAMDDLTEHRDDDES